MDAAAKTRSRLGVEHLEARESPAIVAVNGGGNTPNGSGASTAESVSVLVASPDPGGETAGAIWRNVGGTWTLPSTGAVP